MKITYLQEYPPEEEVKKTSLKWGGTTFYGAAFDALTPEQLHQHHMRLMEAYQRVYVSPLNPGWEVRYVDGNGNRVQ